MKKHASVFVAGSCNVDLTVYTNISPQAGETVFGSRLITGPGGKGLNQATAARRSGSETYFIARTGSDFFAEILLSYYTKEGISTDYIFTDDKEKTGTATIIVDEKTGENRIVVVAGANANLSRTDIRMAEEKIKICDVVLCQLEASFEATSEALCLARKYDKISILNPAPAIKVTDGFFSEISIITPNETEAECYSGVKIKTEKDAFAAGRKLLSLGPKNVIITLGNRGAAIINKDIEMIIPTTDLKPVDTTGAGDAFNGALAAAVSEGMDITEAVMFANCAASISITRLGASESMPHRDEVDALYKRYRYKSL